MELTVRVTETVCGGATSESESVIVAVAVWIPSPNPLGLTTKVSDALESAASEFDAALNVSHEAFDVADQCSGLFPPLLIAIDCVTWLMLPWVAEKIRGPGVDTERVT